jgi:ribose/xylose/arabinose/galactoside ABC-type transport system permease subunit
VLKKYGLTVVSLEEFRRHYHFLNRSNLLDLTTTAAIGLAMVMAMAMAMVIGIGIGTDLSPCACAFRL